MCVSPAGEHPGITCRVSVIIVSENFPFDGMSLPPLSDLNYELSPSHALKL